MPFEISDDKSFEENLVEFLNSLDKDDPPLAAVLKTKLPALLRGDIGIDEVWNALDGAGGESA